MMPRYTYAIAISVALGLPGAGWAQQRDLEVTMGVVPANATPDAVTKVIELPATASEQGRESSAFGLSVANRAREMRGELGRDFGKEVSEEAKARAQARGHGPGQP